MRYKLCKFCENRTRDTPLQVVYIPHFGQIWVKITVFGVLQYTLVTALMGWNLAWRRPKFTPSVQHVA